VVLKKKEDPLGKDALGPEGLLSKKARGITREGKGTKGGGPESRERHILPLMWAGK